MVRDIALAYRGAIALTAFLAVVVSGLFVVEPYIYGRIIDVATTSISQHAALPAVVTAVMPLLVLWAAVTLVSTLLVALHAWLTWYVGNRFEQGFGHTAFPQMLNLDVHHFQDERAGAMLNRFTHAKEALWRISVIFLKTSLPSISSLFIVSAIGFWLDWRLMLAALAVVPLDIFFGFTHLKVSRKYQSKLNEQWEETDGLIGDTFANITTVKSAAGEQRVMKRLAKIYLEILRTQLRVNILWSTIDAGSSFVFSLGRFFIFIVGIRLVVLGQTTLGTMITFLGLATVLYGSVQKFFGDTPELGRCLTRLHRLATFLQQRPEIANLPDAVAAPALRGDVVYDHVSYSYEGGKHVLRNVAVTIPAGKKVAIVGESGAGKSTLVKLMLRFADPQQGRILVDGQDIRMFTLETLRPQIGFVMQENMLFHDTILTNLRFGRPSASRKEVEAAARRAQAHEFISKLPDGYDTVVGERGVKLSGGQKQRIALARVILANPPILVLDEATSALDSKTEHDLQRALRETMRDRTSIVIAHRLSTVMDADMILVMDKGRIVDQGNHEELIKRDGLYRRFWEIQAGGYV